jgi:hypothetical protein
MLMLLMPKFYGIPTEPIHNICSPYYHFNLETIQEELRLLGGLEDLVSICLDQHHLLAKSSKSI